MLRLFFFFISKGKSIKIICTKTFFFSPKLIISKVKDNCFIVNTNISKTIYSHKIKVFIVVVGDRLLINKAFHTMTSTTERT